MNVVSNDLVRMSRLGAIVGNEKNKKKGFIPRIKPLYETPEQEIVAYAAFKNIEHYSEECCPYSWMAKRNKFRDMINKMEDNFPGSKFGVLNFSKQINPEIQKFSANKEVRECEICGSLTGGKICNVCSQLEKLSKSERKENFLKIKPKKEIEKEVNSENHGKECLSCSETKGLKTIKILSKKD